MSRIIAHCALLLLLIPAIAGAVTRDEVEREVKCPTCSTPLNVSDAPVADEMRDFIDQRIADGDSKQEIIDALVDEFGPSVLAVPPKRGFDLVAWLVPLLTLVFGVIAILALSRAWRRRAVAVRSESAPDLDSEDFETLERELRRRRGG